MALSMPMAVLACDLNSRGVAIDWHAADHVQVKYDAPPSAASARAYDGAVACHGTSDGATFLSVVASGELRVPAPLRRRGAEVLAAVNAALPPGSGCFELDASDGELRCRVSRGLSAAPRADGSFSDAPLAAALTEGVWRKTLNAAARHYHVVASAMAIMIQRHMADFMRMDAENVAALAGTIVAEIAAEAAAAAAAAEAAAAPAAV